MPSSKAKGDKKSAALINGHKDRSHANGPSNGNIVGTPNGPKTAKSGQKNTKSSGSKKERSRAGKGKASADVEDSEVGSNQSDSDDSDSHSGYIGSGPPSSQESAETDASEQEDSDNETNGKSGLRQSGSKQTMKTQRQAKWDWSSDSTLKLTSKKGTAVEVPANTAGHSNNKKTTGAITGVRGRQSKETLASEEASESGGASVNGDRCFCILVKHEWRKNRSFQLIEIEAEAEQLESWHKDESTHINARVWSHSPQMDTFGEGASESRSYLPQERAFRPLVLPRDSWVTVTVIQRIRAKVSEDYSDQDDGILSLRVHQDCVVLSEEKSGWSFVRTAQGEQGWFPSGYLLPTQKFVEIKDEQAKVREAYHLLESTSSKAGAVGNGRCGATPSAGDRKAHADADRSPGSGAGPRTKPAGKSPARAARESDGDEKEGTKAGNSKGTAAASANKAKRTAADPAGPASAATASLGPRTPVKDTVAGAGFRTPANANDGADGRKRYVSAGPRSAHKGQPAVEDVAAGGGAAVGDSVAPPSGLVSDKRNRRPTERLSPRWERPDHAVIPAIGAESPDEGDGGPVVAAAVRAGVGATPAPATSGKKKRGGGVQVGGDVEESGGDGDGDVDVKSCPIACTVCYNPHKKLGNAKTVCLLCNRCEGLIKPGWAYYRHQEPEHFLPGHRVQITNLCIYCYPVVHKDGYFLTTPEDDLGSGRVTGSQRRIGKGYNTPTHGIVVEGGMRAPSECVRIKAADFKLCEVKQESARLCQCPFCGQTYHEQCVMYSKEVYGPVPPKCVNPICRTHWEKFSMPDIHALKIRNRARYMQTTPLSDFMEDYVHRTAFRDRGGAAGERRVVVRMVSNVKREQESTPGFTARYGRRVFPYQLKNVLCFLECGDGTDVCFLSLVVAEFGPGCPEPNRNKAYISYIDSVQLYHAAGCAMRGAGCRPATECSRPAECARERKEVVRRVLLGYLDSVGRRGFEAVYIWAMPPNDVQHDYVFHMRPMQQHCPTPRQLDVWYTRLLTLAQAEGVIAGFDSNAQPESDSDGEDASAQRQLPRSLFGPDMSLRHVPQFPGGLMLRALESVLAGDKQNLLLSPDQARTSSSPQLSWGESPASGGRAVTGGAWGGRSRGSGGGVGGSGGFGGSGGGIGTPHGRGGGGVGGRGGRRMVSKETAVQIRERHQRAVEAMQAYLQSRSDSGSIFVIQYGAGGSGSGSGGGGGGRRALEDDPELSVDEDDAAFTLNEVAHLCALLNDLHLQFNDMLHGKHATMVMVARLTDRALLRLDPARRALILSGAATLSDHRAAGKPRGSGGKRAGGESAGGSAPAQEALGREVQKLVGLKDKKAKQGYAVPLIEDRAAEKAIRELVRRRRENLAHAAEQAASHRCNSRCADSKCTKYDTEYNCPVRCNCPFGDQPAFAAGVEWNGSWVFCEWCCSWQHSCCMRDDPRVGYQEALEATGVCYDTDYNYMCHHCSQLPATRAFRSAPSAAAGGARRGGDAVAKRITFPPAASPAAGSASATPARGRGRHPAADPSSSEDEAPPPTAKGKGRGRPEGEREEAAEGRKGGGRKRQREESNSPDPPPSAKRAAGAGAARRGRGSDDDASDGDEGSEAGPGRGGAGGKRGGRGASSAGGRGRGGRGGASGKPPGPPPARPPPAPAARGRGKHGTVDVSRYAGDEIYLSRFEKAAAGGGGGGGVALEVGQEVECEDRGVVFGAVVREVDESRRAKRVLLHFHGWNARHDEWLPADSLRIRVRQQAGVAASGATPGRGGGADRGRGRGRAAGAPIGVLD